MILKVFLLSILSSTFLFTSYCTSKHLANSGRLPSGELSGNVVEDLTESYESNVGDLLVQRVITDDGNGHMEKRFMRVWAKCPSTDRPVIIYPPNSGILEVADVNPLGSRMDQETGEAVVIFEPLPPGPTKIVANQIVVNKSEPLRMPVDLAETCDYFKRLAE